MSKNSTTSKIGEYGKHVVLFCHYYQLKMCIKHRNKVIDDVISNRLREMFENLSIKIQYKAYRLGISRI